MADAEPYIFVAYFDDRDDAERCRAELADLGHRVAQVEPTEVPGDPWGAWRLRAARVMDPALWEREDQRVRAVVGRFGANHLEGYWSLERGEAGWDDIAPPGP